MRRGAVRIGVLALAAGVLACSRRPAAGAASATGAAPAARATRPWIDEMAPLFGGFRLLRRHREVAMETERRGRELLCVLEPPDVWFCPPGDQPATPELPALSFGFRRGVLTLLARSARGEGARLTADTVMAAYRRAFGDPLLEGDLEPGVHTRIWGDADTTALGIVTCFDLKEVERCEVSLEYFLDTDLLQTTVTHARGMMERAAAEKAGVPAPE